MPALCPLPRLTCRHAPSPKRVRLNSCGRHGARLFQPVSYQNQHWWNLFYLLPKYISEVMSTPEIGRIFANAELRLKQLKVEATLQLLTGKQSYFFFFSPLSSSSHRDRNIDIKSVFAPLVFSCSCAVF